MKTYQVLIVKRVVERVEIIASDEEEALRKTFEQGPPRKTVSVHIMEHEIEILPPHDELGISHST